MCKITKHRENKRRNSLIPSLFAWVRKKRNNAESNCEFRPWSGVLWLCIYATQLLRFAKKKDNNGTSEWVWVSFHRRKNGWTDGRFCLSLRLSVGCPFTKGFVQKYLFIMIFAKKRKGYGCEARKRESGKKGFSHV